MAIIAKMRSMLPPPRPRRELEPLKGNGNKYRVQEGGEIRYEGTSWQTATKLFSSITKKKPDVGVLLITNGNVSRRYVPRKEES